MSLIYNISPKKNIFSSLQLCETIWQRFKKEGNCFEQIESIYIFIR